MGLLCRTCISTLCRGILVTQQELQLVQLPSCGTAGALDSAISAAEGQVTGKEI